ncbi:hypothetical protein EZV62_022112 [Acer yangbiense]|uniref:SWIM-type domain-containing protein n=1 Tax=Acer yangbiense TaxID=1000413 RepID=A0A5C7H791_9ROSI|nr:hypothetical protein EZV62_022112 [Acer yangbiense]
MGLDIFEIYVTIDTKVVELGTCDADHISMIVLLYTLSKKQTGSDKVPEDDYSVWVYLSWASEKKEVCSDNDILEVFRWFSEHKQNQIMFEMKRRPYIPAPTDFEASSSTPPRFMGDIPNVAFSGFEQDLFGDNEGDLHYKGDNEDQIRLGDDSGDDESPSIKAGDDESSGLNALAVVPKVPEEVCGDTDEYEDLFEGYQSKSDDEYCNNSSDEVSDAKLAMVVKSNPFKKPVRCPVRFEVGQTHDSVYTLRSLLTDFAIHEGFNFNKVMNDKNRLTWACMAKGCPWRIHAPNVGNDTTMQVKTYKNEHTCHRIYKSKEARSTWITGKFQALVKSNPGIQAGVISNLLRDQFNAVVDTQRLYKAKKKALEVLLKEHEGCFQHLKAYALMVQQCNPGSAAYIQLLEKTSTFQRMFVSFEAQRKGFLEGCMPFIRIDGCHLKGPYGGVLLSAIALDANSGVYPLAYCICEGEIFLSWSWFLEQLRVFLRYSDEKPICFMSDKVSYGRQKLKNLFWKAAKTADRFEFNKLLADIGRAYTANLPKKTCECGQWQVIGLPCSHALVGIRYHFRVHGDEDNLAGFIGLLLSKSAYIRTYSSMIHLIPDLCVWADLDTSHVDAPPLKRLPGKPRLVRKRESGEKQKAAKTGTVVCGNCK